MHEVRTELYRWIVMLLLTMLLAFSGYSISLASRIAIIETKVVSIEGRLYRIENKLDGINTSANRR